MLRTHVTCTWTFLPLSFSESKLFYGLKEKTARPYHLFSFISIQLNTLPKSFHFYFFLKFSVYHISPSNKDTLVATTSNRGQNGSKTLTYLNILSDTVN